MGSYRIYDRRTKSEPFNGYAGRIVERALRPDTVSQWAVVHLPPAVPSVLDLSSGKWTAPLPETTPEDVAHNCDGGVLAEPPLSEWRPVDLEHFGPEMAQRMAASFDCTPEDLVQVPKASLVLFAARWAVDHLSSSPSALVLVREMNSSPEPGVIAWESPMGTVYPISGPSVDRDALANLMDKASSVSGELLILTSTQRLDPTAPLSLLGSDLAELFSDADGLVIGAYDGEGYVRWRRERTV